MLVCAFPVHQCTRDRGCSAHPVFPAPFLEGRLRPLFLRGQTYLQYSGENAPREREPIFHRRPGLRAETHTAPVTLSCVSTTTRRIVGPGSRPGRRTVLSR